MTVVEEEERKEEEEREGGREDREGEGERWGLVDLQAVFTQVIPGR